MTKLTGQCLCGNVKFEADGEPSIVANCHCTDCQQASGSPYATLIFMEREDVKVTGKVSTFSHKVSSGNELTKHFCPTCGSQMFASNEARPTSIGLRGGTVNEKEHVKPQFNVYTSSKIDSTPLDPDLPAFDKMPG